MADYYVNKNKVSYNLSNGRTLVDNYENEKEKELKSRLDKMEETINFKYEPYDFSFMKTNSDSIVDEIEKYLKSIEITNKNKDKQITLGINQKGPYKDKWFIVEGNKGVVIDELTSKPFTARVDYVPSKNKAYIQYMKKENDEIIKKEIDIEFKLTNVTDDEILNEYLK